MLESDTGEATRTEVDGRPVFVLGREGGARMWVAADGSGTLLRVVGPPTDPSDLTFTDWDRARTFTQPAPAPARRPSTRAAPVDRLTRRAGQGEV